jgi:cytochrome c oxidase subunit 2
LIVTESEDIQSLNTLSAPRRLWWGRIGPDERIWLTVAFVWCLVMFTAMVVWQSTGDQRIPVESYTVEEDEFLAEVEEFIAARQIGEEQGVPLVAPEPGEDAYIHASQFQFRPVLQLKKGQTYRLLISSTDVQHGLSLRKLGKSYNFQVIPGYLYVVKLTPQDTGEFSLVCNEFCGLGHHTMTGRVIVVE